MGWQLFLHPRHSFRIKNATELGSMAVRYATLGSFMSLPQFTIAQCIVAYLFYVWVGSAYIFCNFAVSHTHLPVIQADEDVSWVRYASDHTMNVAPGPMGWVNWWMSFLNYQIEHHLFPSMPQFRHPIVSPRVKTVFEKHGVEYIEMSYSDAMVKTFQNLDKVGKDTWYG
jgi:fatty acid desaturase